MDAPTETLFLWKTPSSSETPKEIPAISPLLSYPFILSIALKLIDFQDVVALLTSGNPTLAAYIHRHCTAIRYNRRIGALQTAHQPILGIGDPFVTFVRFPHLQTFSIISPNWVIPAYQNSPLVYLPPTLRHFTLWARSQNTVLERTSFASLTAISFSKQFPDLETLRLCIQHPRDTLPEPKMALTSIPKRIRTLSLVSRFFLSPMDTFRICQPIGREIELDLLSEAEDEELYQSVLEALANESNCTAEYRFPAIEHFECLDYTGSSSPEARLFYHPSPLLMPLTLRTYIFKSDLSLSPLKSRREVKEALRTTPSLAHGLRTFAMESQDGRSSQAGTYDWQYSLPPTITELAVQAVNMKETAKFDFERYLPSLRSFTVFGTLDINALRLPNTLTSLNFTFVSSSWIPLFSSFTPPSSLTHLGLGGISADGLLALLPATLKSFHFNNWTGEQYLGNQVLPHLPVGLQTLRLKVRVFGHTLLQLLPAALQELSIVADSFTGTPFDLSGLPPRLISLKLRSKDNNLHFNPLYFAQLPRTVQYLELSPVTLALSPFPSQAAASSNAPNSSKSSTTKASIGFFAAVKNWFETIASPDEVCDGFVKEETIREALSLLPPNCWCKIRFMASPKGGGFELDELVPQPKELQADLARILPHPAKINEPTEARYNLPILPSYSFISS